MNYLWLFWFRRTNSNEAVDTVSSHDTLTVLNLHHALLFTHILLLLILPRITKHKLIKLYKCETIWKFPFQIETHFLMLDLHTTTRFVGILAIETVFCQSRALPTLSPNSCIDWQHIEQTRPSVVAHTHKLTQHRLSVGLCQLCTL